MRFLFNFLFLLTLFSKVNSKIYWLGEWIASDKWQSEFSIIVNEDGSASSNYGSGEYGEWKLTDGNLTIFWESGKTDYFLTVLWVIRGLEKIKMKAILLG